MRKMQKFNDNVVSWYLTWAILLMSAVSMAIGGESFAIYKKFDWQCWVLMFATAFLVVFAETFRFMALKLEKASVLQ